MGATSALSPPVVEHLRSYRASFHSPARLAVDALGRIYVADPTRGTVVVRAADGSIVRRSEGLGSPTSVAVKEDGSWIYVGDGVEGRVSVYDADWQRLFDLGQGNGELGFPADLALDPTTGDVWVTDSTRHEVKVYDSNGALRLSVGQRGTGAGEFQTPAGIFLDPSQDEVLVADQLNGRIHVFDRQGTWKSCLGEKGSGAGRFNMPDGIWVDDLGRIFVSDAFEGLVHVVDRQAATVAFIGDVAEIGVGPGQLATPSDVVLDPSGRLVVSAGTTARLEMFGLDSFLDPEAFVQGEARAQPAQFEPQWDPELTLLVEIPGYDPALVDLDSVSANGVPATPGSVVLGDADGDGVADLRAAFDGPLVAATLPAEGSAVVRVVGQLGLLTFEAFAPVQVVVPPDGDGDGIPDRVDVCTGFDDTLDADGDGVPDGCDLCAGSNDALDADGDGVADGCDVCAGSNDAFHVDGDGVPHGCDRCVGFDDALDADADGVPDACDRCPGFNDALDADGDRVPDGCDVCPGFNDALDADGDGIPDGCDACIGIGTECGIFADGFESGDTSAWSSSIGPLPSPSP